MFEQGSQRGQLPADGGTAELAHFQRFAPGQNVGAGDGAKILRLMDADKLHEVAQVVFVSAPGLRIIDIGEPFDCGRHFAQLAVLVGSQYQDFCCGCQFGNARVLRFWDERIHELSLQLIKYVINCKQEENSIFIHGSCFPSIPIYK